MSIPHHPLCAVHKGVAQGCDMDCGKGPGGEDWRHVPPRDFGDRSSVGSGGGGGSREGPGGVGRTPGSNGGSPRVGGGGPGSSGGTVLAKAAPRTHTEREAMIVRLIAHHENAFAHVAMAQAKLLQSGGADLSVLDAMTSRMAHHAAVLAELRR